MNPTQSIFSKMIYTDIKSKRFIIIKPYRTRSEWGKEKASSTFQLLCLVEETSVESKWPCNSQDILQESSIHLVALIVSILHRYFYENVQTVPSASHILYSSWYTVQLRLPKFFSILRKYSNNPYSFKRNFTTNVWLANHKISVPAQQQQLRE